MKFFKKIFKKKYWKWFLLPGPKDLGLSDEDALAWSFAKRTKDITWDDWSNIVKTLYPIRYFIIEKVVAFLKRSYYKYVKDSIYWLKCHLLSSYKFHLIDIRRPNGHYPYRYGWLDADTKILYALFKILTDYVEKELLHSYIVSEEDVIKEPHTVHQRNTYLESKYLYYWWTVERERQEKKIDKLSDELAWVRRDGSVGAYQQKLKEIEDYEKMLSETEEKMIARLLKIRHSMWT